MRAGYTHHSSRGWRRPPVAASVLLLRLVSSFKPALATKTILLPVCLPEEDISDTVIAGAVTLSVPRPIATPSRCAALLPQDAGAVERSPIIMRIAKGFRWLSLPTWLLAAAFQQPAGLCGVNSEDTAVRPSLRWPGILHPSGSL